MNTDHTRAVAQRIEVVDKTEARIMGSRTALLKTLAAAAAQSAARGAPTLELKWRAIEGMLQTRCSKHFPTGS